MTIELKYVIANVSDLPAAVAFWRDTVGLKLKFESPDWAEFDTGSRFNQLYRQIRQGHGSRACAFPISPTNGPNSPHGA